MSDAPNPPTTPPRDPAEEHFRRRAKLVVRKRFRGLRATFPERAVAEKSAAIVARLAAHEALRGARCVATFDPIEGKKEVDLRALDASLRARGVALAYPAIDPDTNVMTFRLAAPDELAERGKGFREPPREAPEAAPDVILVPALALDARGHRLGYGAGYYDRALPRYAPPARTVGVCFDFQLTPDLPDTEGDVPVDVVVTDLRDFAAEK